MPPRDLTVAAMLVFTAPCLLAQSAGNFETPNLSLGSGIYYDEALIWYLTHDQGAVLDGWTVEQGTVDQVRHTTGTASLGNQSIDLNGFGPGTLTRTFTTIPGQLYRFGFDFSGNPVGGGVRVLDISVDQKPVAQFVWDPEVEQNSFQSNMKWSPRNVRFTATGTNTTLQLASGNLGLSGPQIDKLTFNPITPTEANTISRFETPVLSTDGGTFFPEAQIWYRTYLTGMSLDGWALVEGSVDLLQHITGTAREGYQTVDLNGIDPGTLRRTFPTVPGNRYRLEFDFSGNPVDGQVRTMAVRVNGVEQGRFEWDPTLKVNSFVTDMKWERRHLEWVAASESTVVELTSLAPGQSGPVVDNVSFALVETSELDIAPAVILSWPMPTWGNEGTVLEEATAATGPWTAVTPALRSVATNGTVTVAVPASAGLRFFRTRNGSD